MVQGQAFQRRDRCVALAALALVANLALASGADKPRPIGTPIMTPSATAAPTLAGETPPAQGKVPQAILGLILTEAAALAKVARDKVAMVRAEPVVWSDGSLGCPEPGMEYTQALVNGYWVVINAAGQTYDFRVGRDGSVVVVRRYSQTAIEPLLRLGPRKEIAPFDSGWKWKLSR